MTNQRLRIKIFLSIIILLFGAMVYGDGEKPISGLRKVFFYTAKKFGIPILRATIKIENEFLEQGKPLYQIQAHVDSLQYLELIFRMKNSFTSTVDAETCSPVRYVKEIDQEGLLIEKKHYLQTLTFDYPNKKVFVAKGEKQERQEIPLLSNTLDPLSMFVRYYLKEEIPLGQDIRMSIFDGMRLREMVFHSKREKIKSKRFLQKSIRNLD